MLYDENTVLYILEKVSKSVVNISTMKLFHSIFYQAVPVDGTGSGTFIEKNGLILTSYKTWQDNLFNPPFKSLN